MSNKKNGKKSQPKPVAPPVEAPETTEGPEVDTETTEAPEAPPETVTVIADKKLNVRSTPKQLDDLSNLVRKVKRGNVLPVVERLDGWVKIGDDEYVMAEFVQ
ncbi:MAG: hypothetical protein LBK67_12855 [Coriobacteriales bacterium]|jgi:biopolymer transport protein ExbD|nr:hypothetical protein [Coriobacteriales bacterium]